MAETEQDRFFEARREMVETVEAELQLLETETDINLNYERVLDVMGQVPRHEFVVPGMERYAYQNTAQSIGLGQTISQPLIVALMTALADIDRSSKVLEVGTGSGYQTAVLGRLAGQVFTVERIASLSQEAAEILAELKIENVHYHVGDGSMGWPEHAPYDAILVTCAAPKLPAPLLEQLANGGRMVTPVGPRGAQTLVRVIRKGDGFDEERLSPVAFVPLIGQYGW